MATFSRSAFNSSAYSAIRPTFPPQVFETIYKYHAAGGGQFRRCVDLGCGTGQSTTVLADHFDEAIGLDPSQPMIERARQLLKETMEKPGNEGFKGSHIKFEVSPAEKLELLGDSTVDLITASQAAHWFDYGKLWPELGRVLKPNGTVAFMGYAEMRLPNHPKLIPMIAEYTQGANSLGPYWEQPGRSIVENLLDAVPSPGPPFVASSVQRIKNSAHYFPRSQVPDPQPILLKKRLTWEGFEKYLKTFSSYHTYLEKNPEDRERDGGDIASRFITKLKEAVIEDGGDANEIDIEWPSVLILVRKGP